MPENQNVKKTGPRKSHSIFRRILKPLCLLTILDAFLLVMVLQAVGVLRQLNQNSFDLFKKQVDNRQSFLQNQMTRRWMPLEDISDHINSRAQALMDQGELDLDKLDSSPKDSTALILEVVDQLIAQLYSKQVSGIYVVFNTHDLQEEAEKQNWQKKTGIYIRDNDPSSVASEKYADLLLECAPVSVVQSLALSTDSGWEPQFKFGPDQPYEAWFMEPYTVASQGNLEASDCGLWSIRQDAQGKSALCYTVPLILPDGRVYGVLGVELLPSFLSTQMPITELDENGVYSLLMTEEDPENGKITGGTLCTVSEKHGGFQAGSQITLGQSKYGGYTASDGETDYTVTLSGLTLYNRNAPFEHQRHGNQQYGLNLAGEGKQALGGHRAHHIPALLLKGGVAAV